MVAKEAPRGLEEFLRGITLDADDPTPGTAAASKTVKVQRRGRDAVLDSADCEIIVYELFQDRA